MGFGEELIEMAYDRTVTNTGGLKWGYMNSILKSWHEKGLFTPADVREKDGRKAKQQPKQPGKPKDLDRLIRELEKI
jgi:DNA replication protein DnaD